nr:hypothetical protein [Bryobacterales bacterium]
ELIAARIERRVRRDASLPHYHSLPSHDIMQRGKDIANNLGHWMQRRNDMELVDKYEWLGRKRYREGIPLAEVMRVIYAIKTQIIEFAREQHLDYSPLEMQAETELVRALGRCFDLMIYAVAKGYLEAAGGEQSNQAAA